jgi:hypothetical protein
MTAPELHAERLALPIGEAIKAERLSMCMTQHDVVQGALMIAKLDEVAKRWPVEIGRLASGRPRYAGACDLMLTEADGWPAAPMRAWWGRYGEHLARWPFDPDTPWRAGCAPCLVEPHGRTPAAAMQSAAVAMMETADERP